MTTPGPLQRVTQRSAASTAKELSQATAVEQSRAVAEVQAIVVVAQNVPRNLERVREEMVEACKSYSLASRAFYSVKNRGEGPSVHLARELARIFGNFQYGVHELRRDDAAGISEVQAFAWDCEKNTRSTRTFISPHQRMAGGKRVDLVDLTDVYLMNQNQGARAVRECILSSLPQWLLDEAEQLCKETLQRGTGKSLADRAADAVQAFSDKHGVTEAQLVARIGRPRDQWTGEDIASLEVVYRSLVRGETTVDEQFDAAGPTVSAKDIIRTASDAAATRDEARPTIEQQIVDDATKPGKALGKDGGR